MLSSTLMIDDQKSFLESMRIAFEAEGINLDVADTWDEGLALFRVGLHELVVADYNLVGSKHGLKLLAEAKRMRSSSRLVLISGAVTPSAGDLLGAGDLVDRFLAKESDLLSHLLEEARDAVLRAEAATSWPDAAQAQIQRGGIDQAALDAVDAALSSQLGR